MDGKAKACIAILAVALLAAICLSGGRKDVSDNGNRADAARNELESAAGDNGRIEERIGEAESTAKRIEESAQLSGELAGEAEDILADCQRIVGEVRQRGAEE